MPINRQCKRRGAEQMHARQGSVLPPLRTCGSTEMPRRRPGRRGLGLAMWETIRGIVLRSAWVWEMVPKAWWLRCQPRSVPMRWLTFGVHRASSTEDEQDRGRISLPQKRLSCRMRLAALRGCNVVPYSSPSLPQPRCTHIYRNPKSHRRQDKLNMRRIRQLRPAKSTGNVSI